MPSAKAHRSRICVRRALRVVAILACGLTLTPAAAGAAAEDPLFVFLPAAGNPPVLSLNGPCGMAVNFSGTTSGNFYVSNHYADSVQAFTPPPPPYDKPPGPADGGAGTDGPCGIAIDSTDTLYVNNYHRNVVRFPGCGRAGGLGVRDRGGGRPGERRRIRRRSRPRRGL